MYCLQHSQKVILPQSVVPRCSEVCVLVVALVGHSEIADLCILVRCGHNMDQPSHRSFSRQFLERSGVILLKMYVFLDCYLLLAFLAVSPYI